MPTFREDHLSQIPALRTLLKLGWRYLSPEEALAERGNKTSAVLLENILRRQLARINAIRKGGKTYDFSAGSLDLAIKGLRELSQEDGFREASKRGFELLTQPISLPETIGGVRKSYSLRYIDWDHPERNVFHVTEEFKVKRSGKNSHYRPDIVLFVNGIPLAVMECKSPQVQGSQHQSPVELGIEQHLRNQQGDGIRKLYQYAGLLFSLATTEAKYGTAATPKEFWSLWRTRHPDEAAAQAHESRLFAFKNRDLPPGEQAQIFRSRYATDAYARFFERLDAAEKVVTAQDRLLHQLTDPERFLDFIFHYTLFENSIRIVARYQQYDAVRKGLQRIRQADPKTGKRPGGVIWHTQGSGKSFTMVMLAQQIRRHVPHPRIVLVTDRVDLDDQIKGTFAKCGQEVKQASQAASQLIRRKLKGEPLSPAQRKRLAEDDSLLALLDSSGDHVVTSVVNKFVTAVEAAPGTFDSPDIFVLVDEGHRSHYGTFAVKMRQVFPKACFIAFTGTPLKQKEKDTADKFGGWIDTYTIEEAVADGAVLPLLYDGRHLELEVNDKPLNAYFERVSQPLTEEGKASLKRKFSTKSVLNKAEQVIYARAWDISDHFVQHVADPEKMFKGQLVAPDKASALRYHEILNSIGKVSSMVLISPPDQREGVDSAFQRSQDKVREYWESLKDEFGSPEKYQKHLINHFKNYPDPEIVIVVDKLLTGFDAPRNSVLYITRSLREHSLLQAIARVNRLHEGKEYGLIVDYYGNLGHLDSALKTYSALDEFDAADLSGAITPVTAEAEQLPQVHSELWDLFRDLPNEQDTAAYVEFLFDEAVRHAFYEKLSAYARMLRLALSSFDWNERTPAARLDKYKSDLKFFLSLRATVRRRYSDTVDFREFESKVKQLIDQHLTTDGNMLQLTGEIEVFDEQQREEEMEKQGGKAAQADYIASRTLKAIEVKMDEDPVYYKKLSQLLREAIEDYHAERISEAEFLQRAQAGATQFNQGRTSGIPDRLLGHDPAQAFYSLLRVEFDVLAGSDGRSQEIAAELALRTEALLDQTLILNGLPVVDWRSKEDLQNRLRTALDDLLFAAQQEFDIDFPLADLDQWINEVIRVAKARYA